MNRHTTRIFIRLIDSLLGYSLLLNRLVLPKQRLSLLFFLASSLLEINQAQRKQTGTTAIISHFTLSDSLDLPPPTVNKDKTLERCRRLSSLFPLLFPPGLAGNLILNEALLFSTLYVVFFHLIKLSENTLFLSLFFLFFSCPLFFFPENERKMDANSSVNTLEVGSPAGC